MAKREGDFSIDDFYAAEAVAHAPIAPDLITVNRYIDNLRALGKVVRYNAAAKRLQAKEDAGEIVLVGKLYDAQSGRKVKVWKIDNAKQKPNKAASVSKNTNHNR